MAGLQKLLGYTPVQATQGASNPFQPARVNNNFVKNTFNFGGANPNRPYGVVEKNALGDPPKGTNLYCLG